MRHYQINKSVCFILLSLVYCLVVLKYYDTYTDNVIYQEPETKIGFRNIEFNYLINPGYQICGQNMGADLTLLAFILTQSDGFTNRLLHRKTWASRSLFPKLRVIYLVGYSLNSTVNQMIREESYLYGDIVQEDYLDTYRYKIL